MILMKLILAFLLSAILLACGGGGGGGDQEPTPDPAPEPALTPNLQDALSQQFIQGEPVNIKLVNTGKGELVSCEAPTLPANLNIIVSNDLQNCIITGDAFTLIEATDIPVTATNSGGSSQAILPLSIVQASPFILNVRATSSEASGQRSFIIRHNPDLTYDYTVDWGDGSELERGNGSTDLRHTYAGNNVSVFTVTITGIFPQQSLSRPIRPENSIASVEQWGNQPWRSLQQAFANIHNLEVNASDLPNLEHTSTLSQAFQNAEGFNEDISQWNVSNVTDMSEMFSGTTLSIENYDLLLNTWSNLALQEDVDFDAGNSHFSSISEAARAILNDNFSWNINDAGSAVPQLASSVDQIKIYTNHDAEFTFKNLGFDVSVCESSSLPSGVSVETFEGSCQLTGIPNNVAESQEASVTAINDFGQSTIEFNIQVIEETPYITRWKTDNEGESNNNGITIYTAEQHDYNFVVDWGDGNIDEDVTETITHIYAEPGEYEVSITGRFPQPHFPNRNNTDAPKLLNVKSWGERPWLSMRAAFFNAINLEIDPSTQPDLSRVTDMSSMFQSAIGFNSDIGHWDVSNIETMVSLFSRASTFDQNIGDWEVSNVKSMASMFSRAANFNQDISGWDMRSVKSIRFMFNFAEQFNQPIGNWNTSSVKDMSATFRAARRFNQPLENWQTSSVTTMEELFDGAINFNQNIGNWDTTAVTNMRKMFNIAFAFNQDISNWDVANVTNMTLMFKQANSFNQDVSTWDVSNVTNMDNMFERALRFDQSLAEWDIRKVQGNSMLNHTFSTENYDAMLIAWSQLDNLQENVILEAGDSGFSPEAEAARNTLLNQFNWTINDGGNIATR